MKLLLQNTNRGLIPLYDADFDEKKKLKIGDVYEAEIKLKRNLEFHRKYFALINCAWEYLPEKQVEGFGNITKFREYLQVSAGHYELFFSPKLREWVEVPKSISFEKMDNIEFSELYDRVKDVIFRVFLKHISVDAFESELINF